MNSIPRHALRLGVVLSILVALLTFLIRTAGAQQPTPRALSLGDAARLAAQQSAAVEGAQARVSEARSRVAEARSALLPDFSGNASATNHSMNTATFGISFPAPPGQPPLFNPNGQVIRGIHITDLRARAAQNLFDFSAIQRVRGAQTAVQAASADVANAGEQAATQASMAYLGALRTEAQLQARLADSALAADLLTIARDQLAAGVGVALDVTRAQAQLVGVHAQLIAARNDRDRTRLQLLRTLNLSLDTPLQLTDSLAEMPTDSLTLDERAAEERAMRSRPDILAAQAQLRAAQQQVSAIRAERLPTVSAFADDGAIGMNYHTLLPTYDLGLQVSVPFFDGFRRQSRVQEQESVANEADIRFRDLQQQTAVDVRSALLDLSSARQQVDAARERLRLAEQEVTQARDRFRAGVAGNADVITASLNLNDARNLVIDALTNYQSARVALAHAEGSVTELH